MAVTLAKKRREKTPRDDTSKMNPSTVRPPPKPTDDLAGFEPETSVTGIRADAFRKTAVPLGYARLVYFQLPMICVKYLPRVRVNNNS